jgi:hypothetical protein
MEVGKGESQGIGGHKPDRTLAIRESITCLARQFCPDG